MAKIPVSILTGFLGSGKTTLLAQILERCANRAIAVVVNECGQVGLDTQVLAHLRYVPEKMRLLQGGCVCCAYRQDLIDSLKALISDSCIDHVVVETSGIANPAPILFSLLHDVFLSQHFIPHNVITCLDGVHGFSHLKDNVEAQHQIATSNVVVITKTDLQDSFAKLSTLVASTNPTATLYDKARIDVACLLQESPTSPICATPPQHTHQYFRTLCLEFEERIDWSAFSLWLSFLLYQYGDRILRTKGIIRTEQACIALNGVQHIIYPPTHLSPTQEHLSQLVFILKDLDPQAIHTSLKTLFRALGVAFNPRHSVT
ncbi:GTP-binding protein [Helicobacter sp. L8]|uniref:CobW family GTP-binding protein n=1 Tax=Helicobacter sp. L8 TaxID=2316078 RepID=UPI000EB4EDA9|nr:GTP-binding protein [Helicobacter sp. L8]